MAAKKETAGAAGTGGVNTEEILKPFHEAGQKFLQANAAAQEAAVQQSTKATLDFQDAVRKLEQKTYDAVTDLTRKHAETVSKLAGGGGGGGGSAGTPAEGSDEDPSLAYAQAQLDYEKALRQIYGDAQGDFAVLAQKAFGEDAKGGSPVKTFNDQRQNAYQSYLSDLSKAWSGVKQYDPQTVSAIATHILYTVNSIGQ